MADPPPPVAQPDELSPLDYLLHRGESHPATRSAFLNLEILDRPADWGRLREALDRASRVVIRMRQKVVVPALPTTPPRWVVDPDFDLDYHLRRVALPAPGTLRQLLDLAEVTLQSPLDTSRALWEAVYVEGLEGGKAALLTKLSHAITDGLGGIALFEQVYDTERDPEPRPMPPVPVPRDVSGSDLVRDSLRHLPETTLATGRRLLGGAAGTVARLVTRPGSTVTEALGFADSARRMLSPPPAEPSPLLRRRSLVTRTLVLELPLAELRAAAKAVVVSAGPGGYEGAGGPPVRRGDLEGIVPPASRTASVNDAYLAALCGGLGRYHEALGVPVDALPLTLPVSLRGADDPASGNRIAGVTIAAPIGESDPAERMKQVREQVIARRGEPALDVIGRLAPVLSLLPDEALYDVVDRITPPDIQASNVPGYAQDTFLAGARVERQYGLGPLPRVAMMAILISRAGTCTVAFRYDTASFTAADLLEKCLQAGFDEIVELGRIPARSVSKARPTRGGSGGSSLPEGGPGGWVPPGEEGPAEPRRTS
jgi:diacylglycerol O-acyltransferase